MKYLDSEPLLGGLLLIALMWGALILTGSVTLNARGETQTDTYSQARVCGPSQEGLPRGQDTCAVVRTYIDSQVYLWAKRRNGTTFHRCVIPAAYAHSAGQCWEVTR